MHTGNLTDPPKQQGQRKRLVELLRKEGIQDERTLLAIGQVRRHWFVDSTLHDMAYQNIALPIAGGQTISQPWTVARQTELLQLPRRNPRVLEIGTGSGYQAAVLCQMGVTVFSIERNAELFAHTKQLLAKLGYEAWLKLGDGTLGWPEYAPYDGIVVTAGAPEVPTALLQQLGIGARLVIPVGDRSVQSMRVITRTAENSWETADHGQYKFVPLIGREGWEGA